MDGWMDSLQLLAQSASAPAHSRNSLRTVFLQLLAFIYAVSGLASTASIVLVSFEAAPPPEISPVLAYKGVPRTGRHQRVALLVNLHFNKGQLYTQQAATLRVER